VLPLSRRGPAYVAASRSESEPGAPRGYSPPWSYCTQRVLAVAGAASFLTPVVTPANTMVLEPGGYRFGDYWKLGLPLVALFLAVAVLYVPVVWSFG
jgi:di/tricarboxylate transporter